MRILLPLVTSWFLASCATVDDREPDQVFDDTEARFVGSDPIEVDFDITSTGAVETSFKGSMRCAGAALTLDFDGSINGRPVRGSLCSDGTTLTLQRNGDQAFSMAAPDHLRHGICVGAMRMGLLHNLFVMSQGGPPERIDGTADEWVRVDGLREMEDGGIGFELLVDGQESGNVVLTLDEERVFPTHRLQVVDFGGGRSMQVDERYTVRADR